jgi:hypothetical protein
MKLVEILHRIDALEKRVNDLEKLKPIKAKKTAGDK